MGPATRRSLAWATATTTVTQLGDERRIDCALITTDCGCGGRLSHNLVATTTFPKIGMKHNLLYYYFLTQRGHDYDVRDTDAFSAN